MVSEATFKSSNKRLELEAESEARFEVEEKQIVSVELKSGTAEIFGSELIQDKPVVLYPGTKVAVYTWHGCILQIHVEHTENSIEGEVNQNASSLEDISYVSKETPNITYTNIHAILEKMRKSSAQSNTQGPRVMVVGPTDVGKTSLCLILANYAVRMGWKPIYVDIDVGQGAITIPGNIAAILVEKPIDIQAGLSLYSNVASPMVLHFGHTTPSDNTKLYMHTIARLAEIVNAKCAIKPKINASGVIINTCGWVKQLGYTALTHTAQAFEVDVVLVLDHERLYNELKKDLPSFVKVVLIPKSGGVVSRSKFFRCNTREKRVKEYFYGNSSVANNSSLPASISSSDQNRFFPHLFDVKFDEISIFRVGTKLNEILPDSCLPIGMKRKDEALTLFPITPNAELTHHIASVSLSQSQTEEDVLNSNIAGFVCITEVKMDKGLITLLSPQPKPLPSNILLLSEIQFVDYS